MLRGFQFIKAKTIGSWLTIHSSSSWRPILKCIGKNGLSLFYDRILIAQDYIKFLKETDKEWQLETLILYSIIYSIISYSFSFLTSFIFAFGLLISFHNLQQICMNSEDSYDTLNKCCEFWNLTTTTELILMINTLPS